MNKQIEEMAHDMCEYYYEGTCYQDKKPCDCKCYIFTDAQYLYGKGYRKYKDVVEKIFAEIEKHIQEKKKAISMFKDGEDDFYDGEIHALEVFAHLLAELKKKYESDGADDE